MHAVYSVSRCWYTCWYTLRTLCKDTCSKKCVVWECDCFIIIIIIIHDCRLFVILSCSRSVHAHGCFQELLSLWVLWATVTLSLRLHMLAKLLYIWHPSAPALEGTAFILCTLFSKFHCLLVQHSIASSQIGDYFDINMSIAWTPCFLWKYWFYLWCIRPFLASKCT